MSALHRIRFMRLLAVLLGVMLAVPAVALAAQPPVDLLSTSSFAILAGTTITNTGATTINGDAGSDIGLYPGSSFTGSTTVTTLGSVHIGDPTAITAKTDLVTVYDDAAGRTPVTRIPSQLGGHTLLPGVYDSADGQFKITGTLTLDAEGDPNAVFVFKTRTTLITASGSRVNLVNSARFCRVFWKVGSSATLGTTSHFVGHIFALTSITANTGATVQGQLLARNGAVTLHGNTITNGLCATVNGPAIFLRKLAAPMSLPFGGGPVTYTYRVTNPGTEVLSGLVVTDDKLATLTYVSGDLNEDGLLQPGEIWIYTAATTLTGTTTNTATATASFEGTPLSSASSARVVVGGAVLPNTATPWYNVLLAGVALTFLGAVGWFTRKSYE